MENGISGRLSKILYLLLQGYFDEMKFSDRVNNIDDLLNL